MFRYCIVFSEIFSLLFLLNCSSRTLREDSKFSYKNVYRDKYEDGKGGVIPVTFEKGETFSGTITADGNYLFFSSNRLGNYDIYLRALDDVENVPIIKTATNQKEPSISPDGSKLVYLEDELDPDGDLVYVAINPKTVAKRFKEGDPEPFKPGIIIGRKKNLTNSEKRRVRSRESNPTWSPDSQKIAFSSDMTSMEGSDFGPGLAAIQNIWLLDPDSPDKAEKLTDKGGVMPAFSPDGQRVAYISYEEQDSNGNVYEIDLPTRKRRKLTGGSAIDLNPAYSTNGKELFLTRINRDTNGDGHIDRKDSGRIFKIHLQPWEITSPNNASGVKEDEKKTSRADGKETQNFTFKEPLLNPVTLSSDNVFDTRVSNFLGGAITFAFTSGEDVNIAFIPVDGIVPRKKNIKEQLSFAQEYNKTMQNGKRTANAQEIYVQALRRVREFFPEDKLLPVVGAEADLRLLDILSGEEKENLTNEIKKKISAGENSYRFLLDIGHFKNDFIQAGKTLSYPKLVEAPDLKTYYRKVLLKRDIWKYYRPERLKSVKEKLLKELNEKTKQSVNDSTAAQITELPAQEEKKIIEKYEAGKQAYLAIISELRLRYSELFKGESVQKENIRNLADLLRENPDFTEAAHVVFLMGNAKLDTDIPEELLHLLYPERFPLKITKTKEFPGGEVTEDPKESKETEKPEKKPKSETQKVEPGIQINISEGIKKRTERTIYEYVLKQFERANSSFLKLIEEKYTEKDFPRIFRLYQLAQAQHAITNLAVENAETALQKARRHITKDSFWDFLGLKIQGQILELKNSPEQAYSDYYNALITYRPQMRYSQAESLTQRVLTYYTDKAKNDLSRSDYTSAWQNYRKVAELQIDLYAKNVKRAELKNQILETMVDINLMTIARVDSDEKFYENVRSFYDQKMDIARRDLNNSFIFSRAYLDTQLGINLHRKYEADGMSSSRKERVLKLFKSAEIDFKWSFFADPYFADSYVMLGWMYQFIDEKREQLVDDADQKKDKDEYESLYVKYFADYLFEENIRLYQKSIAYFSGSLSPGILRSFHLNMGNNYFLLGNYAKARENYQYLLDKTGNMQYEFESDKQKALFSWHLGRTLYYTGEYALALKYLNLALQIYEKEAPINSGDVELNKASFHKRNKLLRMLALTSDISGDKSSASSYYDRILIEQNQTGITDDRSFLYIEKARYAYEAENYELAFEYLTEAENYLPGEKEVKAPSFKIRIKWLGFYQPWTFIAGIFYTHDYDKVYNGKNKLAFPLPTVNRWQYIWSLKADIFRKKNLLSESQQALLKLKEYAEKDKTVHGKETFNAALMRLGETSYLQKRFNDSRDYYNEAFKIAEKRSDFGTQSKIRKNLLAIATYEIENTPAELSDKMKKVKEEIENLNEFRNKYIEKSVQSDIDARKKQNEAVPFTETEINDKRKKAGKEIYAQLLYNGVFNSHITDLKEILFHETLKAMSYNEYISQRTEVFKEFQKTLQYFSGNIEDSQFPGGWVNYLDKKDYSLRIKLAMNRGRLYQNLFLFSEARQEYQTVLESANEFQAQLIMILVSYRLYRISDNSKEGQAYLSRAATLLKDNPEYVSRYADLYNSVAQRQTQEHLKQGNFIDAINTEDQRRHYSAWDIYAEKYNITHERGKKLINDYNYFIRQKSIFRDRIEATRFSRSDSKADEKTLLEIDKQISNIKKSLFALKEISSYVKLAFPSEDIRGFINKVQKPVLYIMRHSGNKLFLITASPSSRKKKSRKGESLVISHGEFKVTAEEISQGAQFIQQAESKDKANTAKVPDWIQFIRNSNAEILFIDKDFLKFPFSKIMGKPVAVEGTLTAAAFFNSNREIPGYQVMQINQPKKGFGFLFGGAVKYNSPLEITSISTEAELKKASPMKGILDYEASLTGSARTEDLNAVDISIISKSENNPTGAFVSYSAGADSDQLSEYKYFSAVNLILSANGCSAVIHSGTSRKNSTSIFERGFYLQKVTEQLGLVSGNYNLVSASLDMKNNEASNEFLSVAISSGIRSAISLAEKNHKEEKYAEAVMAIKRGEDLSKLSQLLLQKKLEMPDLNLTENKAVNLIAAGDLKAGEEVYKAYANRAKSQQVRELYRKKIFTLFKHGFDQEAFGYIQSEKTTFDTFSGKNLDELTESMLYGQIRKGNLALLSAPFPAILAKTEAQENWSIAPVNNKEGNLLPPSEKQILGKWAGKTGSIEKNDWSAALYKSGYFEHAQNLGILENKTLGENSQIWYKIWIAILAEGVGVERDKERAGISGKFPGERELDKLGPMGRDYMLMRKHLSKGDITSATVHAALGYKNDLKDPFMADAFLWPLVVAMNNQEHSADKVRLIAQFLGSSFRNAENFTSNPQLKYKYGLLAGLPEFLRNGQDFLKYRAKNKIILSSGNATLEKMIALAVQRFNGIDLSEFSDKSNSYGLDIQANETIRNFRAGLAKTHSVADTIMAKRLLITSFFRKDFDNAFKHILTLENAKIKSTEIDTGKNYLMGIYQAFPGEYYGYTFKNGKVSMEKLKDNTAISVEKFIKSESERLLFLGEGFSYTKIENLRIPAGTLFVNSLVNLKRGTELARNSPENRPLVYEKTENPGPMNALLEISLPLKNKEKSGKYKMVSAGPQKGIVTYLHIQDNRLSEKEIRNLSSKGHILACEKSAAYNIFLQFADALVREMRNSNLDAPEAYKVVQKTLGRQYPREVTGFWLVKGRDQSQI